MHATIRRIKTKPGKAAEVAALIEAEYLPQLGEGLVSYTLVDVGDDEVSSVGVFTTADGAEAANATAAAWTRERLGPLVDSPLEARAGTVLVDFRP